MSTPHQPRSPRDIAGQVVSMVEGNRDIVFADLFAPDGVLEFPFAPPGAPERLDGADAIRAFHAQVAQVTRGTMHIEEVHSTVHETIDPEVVIIEIEHRGHSDTIGGPYRTTTVGVLRARDGAIVSYRDYMDPIVLARLSGQATEVAAALTS